jgi:hypothetical protein
MNIATDFCLSQPPKPLSKQPIMNPIRQLGKHLTFLFLFMTVVGVTMAKAQDKYTFFSFEMYNEATDTYYLVVSDPVKNWYNDLSKEQRDDFVTDFRVTANKQAGVQVIKISFLLLVMIVANWLRCTN